MYYQTRTNIPPGYYQHPQHLVEQLLQQMKCDFEARYQELIADGTLVQPVNFLLDLRYNVHSQLIEIYIKHKPGAPVQIDKEGKEHAAVTLLFPPFLAKIMGLKMYFFVPSVFTLQIECLIWIQCLPFTFILMSSNLALWVILKRLCLE